MPRRRRRRFSVTDLSYAVTVTGLVDLGSVKVSLGQTQYWLRRSIGFEGATPVARTGYADSLAS